MSTKKLISYNSEKHPEVARFFEELEDTNLTSHYVREAIKFYQQYKEQNITIQPINAQNNNIHHEIKENEEELIESKPQQKNNDDDHEPFDPKGFFN